MVEKSMVAKNYKVARFWLIENMDNDEYRSWHSYENNFGRELVPMEIQIKLNELRDKTGREKYEFPEWDKDKHEYISITPEDIQRLRFQVEQLIWKMQFDEDETNIGIIHKIDDMLKSGQMDIVWKVSTTRRLSRKITKTRKDIDD